MLIISLILTLFRNRFHINRLLIFLFVSLGFWISTALFIYHDLRDTFNYEVLDISLLGIVAFMLLKKNHGQYFTLLHALDLLILLLMAF